MNSALKVLLALATLPLVGFVVGSLVSTARDEPPPRPAIEMTDRGSEPSLATPSRPTVVTPRPSSDEDRDDQRFDPGDDGQVGPGVGGGDDDDGDEGDDDGEDGGDD